MRDKLMRLIFEAMVSSPGGGLELQPAKHKGIEELINRVAVSKESADVNVVYEIIGHFAKTGSKKAADVLSHMMMRVQAAVEAERAERAMWAGARP
jgi:hypothetical protein